MIIQEVILLSEGAVVQGVETPLESFQVPVVSVVRADLDFMTCSVLKKTTQPQVGTRKRTCTEKDSQNTGFLTSPDSSPGTLR